MKILKLLFFAFFYLSTSFAQKQEVFPSIAEPKQPEKIRVLIAKEAKEALLEVTGPYYVYNPHDDTRIASGLLGKRFLVHSIPKGIKWGEEFLGIHQIYITPRSEETSLLVNGIQYEGGIAIYSVGNKLNIVNHLDIENYVKAILAPQFPYPLENEVMSSLAILARTDAYFQVMKNKEAFWHVDAKESSYKGCVMITPGSFIDKTVDSTKYLILAQSYQGKNLPFPAKWSEHSAGKTASYKTIFRKKEALTSDKGVEAPQAALDREESHWSFSLSKKNLAHLIGAEEVQEVETFVDSDSHKAYAVRLVMDQGKKKDFNFLEFQELLGASQLKSSDFQVKCKGDSIQFSGYGKGHGVGLCLYSASVMAQNGESALKILSKFYPETFLYNLSAIPETNSLE